MGRGGGKDNLKKTKQQEVGKAHDVAFEQRAIPVVIWHSEFKPESLLRGIIQIEISKAKMKAVTH